MTLRMRGPDVGLDLRLQRARGSRQRDLEPDVVAVDVDGVDHSQRDEVLVQFRVVDALEGLQYAFSGDFHKLFKRNSAHPYRRHAG